MHHCRSLGRQARADRGAPRPSRPRAGRSCSRPPAAWLPGARCRWAVNWHQRIQQVSVELGQRVRKGPAVGAVTKAPAWPLTGCQPRRLARSRSHRPRGRQHCGAAQDPGGHRCRQRPAAGAGSGRRCRCRGSRRRRSGPRAGRRAAPPTPASWRRWTASSAARRPWKARCASRPTALQPDPRRCLEWRAEVPASELAQLQAGQKVRVLPAGGTQPLEGKVRVVAPTVDATTRLGRVLVDLSGSPAAARAGMFARGDFVLGDANVLTCRKPPCCCATALPSSSSLKAARCGR